MDPKPSKARQGEGASEVEATKQQYTAQPLSQFLPSEVAGFVPDGKGGLRMEQFRAEGKQDVVAAALFPQAAG